MTKLLLLLNIGDVTAPSAKPSSDISFFIIIIIIATVLAILTNKNKTSKKNKKTKKETETIMRCEKCGVQIDKDSKFCKSCGAKQNDEQIDKFCSKCGAPLKNQIKCDNCNHTLSK